MAPKLRLGRCPEVRVQRQADANAKEVGQLQAANKINAQTVETQDAMDGVARPSDDAVADSLRSGKFCVVVQIVCPRINEYDAKTQDRALAEYSALPAGSALRLFIGDYKQLRDQIRVCRARSLRPGLQSWC
jgi:hypothetical protein